MLSEGWGGEAIEAEVWRITAGKLSPGRACPRFFEVGVGRNAGNLDKKIVARAGLSPVFFRFFKR